MTFLPAAPLVAFDWQSGGDVRHNVSEQATSALQASQVPAVAFAQNQRGELRTSDIAPQLTTGGGKPGEGYSAIAIGVDGGETGYALRANASHSGDKGDGGINTTMVASPLVDSGKRGWSSSVDSPNFVASQMSVRRLMPVECERLQGWPDGWTERGASGKVMSDSTRYRMVGNGVATPVAEWIARRIADVTAAEGSPA